MTIKTEYSSIPRGKNSRTLYVSGFFPGQVQKYFTVNEL